MMYHLSWHGDIRIVYIDWQIKIARLRQTGKGEVDEMVKRNRKKTGVAGL